MKKVALALISILVIIALVVPFYSGKKAHELLDNLVLQANVKAPGSVAWVSYEQGWFQSHALLNINVSSYFGLPLTSPEEAVILPLQFDLHHGPVIVDSGLEWGWFKSHLSIKAVADSWLAKNVQYVGEGPLALSTVRVSLTGGVTSAESVMPMSVATRDGVLKIDGFQGNGGYIPLGPLTYKAQLTTAELKSGLEQLVMDGAEIYLKSELQRIPVNFAIPGEVTIKIKKVKASDGDNVALMLDDSNFMSSLALPQATAAADIQFKLNVGRAEALGDVLTDIVADIALQRVSLAFYEKYAQMVRSSAGAPVSGMQILSLINDELIPLGPEVLVNQMGFTAPEGKMTLNGFLRVAANNANPQGNPFSALGQMTAAINWTADKPLTYRLLELNSASSIDQKIFANGQTLSKEQRDAAIKENAVSQVNMLLMQRYLMDKGSTFESKIALEKGKAVINDQIFPLPF